jgi:glycosyltransferase involved in cell wall biosynthesis
MKKLIYISSIAVPHQIKLCKALNKYIDTEFWFYEYLNEGRPAWWKIPLCKKCKILNNLLIRKNSKYFTFDVVQQLNDTNPDIVMLGGFSIPSNYLAYRWAKKNNKKTIVFTELSRDGKGVLRPYNMTWKIIRYLYRHVDYVFTSNSDTTEQFTNDFKFGNKVITTRYASDLDSHLRHSSRRPKEGYTYLVANRLIDIYNPLLAIDIFSEIQKKYPKSKLLMNNQGELKEQCLKRIHQYKIETKVEFLSDIEAWDDLPKVYEKSDILIFPAIFSNGNFSINEAMASGMGIVISTKINGHTDTLTHNKNCFIIEPNKKEFVDAIEKYIHQPELLRNHSEINKVLMEPLSIEGTAKFFYEKFLLLELDKK